MHFSNRIGHSFSEYHAIEIKLSIIQNEKSFSQIEIDWLLEYFLF